MGHCNCWKVAAVGLWKSEVLWNYTHLHHLLVTIITIIFLKECRAITLLAPKAGMEISPFFLFLFSEYISGIGIRMRVGIGYASVRERSANFKMKVVA